MDLKSLYRSFKRELKVYQAIAKHPKTPRRARWLLGAALGYVFLPFDLIPDFLPLIGHLDDAVIVPGLVYLALKSVPPEIVEECRAASQENG
jgi:uncharacterized membrane protein YkvA (DUF1232 family)